MVVLLLAIAHATQPYAGEKATLAKTRAELAAAERTEAVRDRARDLLTDTVRDGLIPPWVGTEWDFYGTSQTPGSGQIACGYFVSTILRDAGFGVERVKLAQQASEYIVKTFSEDASIRRFRTGDEQAVVDAVLAEPEGIYVVGLDFHVGFLIRRDQTVEFCHSTYLDRAGVVCEDPVSSPAFASEYHVVGPVLEDAVIDAWLDQKPLATVTR